MYIAAMTIINSVREVIHMPVSGVGNGAQPVMSFNYGAKEYGRVKQTIRYTAVILLVYTLFAWGMTMLFPNQFVMIFNKDAELLAAYSKIHAYLFLRIFLHGISIHRADDISGTWKIKAGNLLFHVKEGHHCCTAYVLLPVIPEIGVTGVFLAEPISNRWGTGLLFYHVCYGLSETGGLTIYAVNRTTESALYVMG